MMGMNNTIVAPRQKCYTVCSKRSGLSNSTIGVILCSEKDETIVKYSIPKENRQLFASKYRLYLPTEDELVAEIEREKLLLKEKFEKN